MLTDTESQSRRRRVIELATLGELEGAARHLEDELAQDTSGNAWLSDAIIQAMLAEDLRPAGNLARVATSVRLGASVMEPDSRALSAGKLEHDIAQLKYLLSRGVIDSDIKQLLHRYESIIQNLAPQGCEARRSLSPEERLEIGDVYGRLVHLRETPRVGRALSRSWDPAAVETQYLTHRPGVVVIDDFLNEEALEEVRRFCLESTVWNGNRYPHGRLGAFFDAGFNCPLLLQIAEELRTSFPRLIGEQHGLRQLWGFKYPPQLPPDSTIHADFAAVNVNFWITPDQSNRDPSSGGMAIYDIDAPRDWDFSTYNERLDIIKDFLRRCQATVIRIPYRQNRAIVFNSDLFHATEAVNFGTDYVDRRINITMLYGVREQDAAHPVLAAGRMPADPSLAISPAWRSPALTRARTRL